jgi:hypothetical protein
MLWSAGIRNAPEALPAGEKGQIDVPESEWIRHTDENLRIIDADLAAQVDAKRIEKKSRYLTALVSGGRVTSQAAGRSAIKTWRSLALTVGDRTSSGGSTTTRQPWCAKSSSSTPTGLACGRLRSG